MMVGSEGGRRGFTGTCMEGFIWRVPRQPSARLTHGPKLDTAMWLLRCSILRETPMASAIHFKKLNCYSFSRPASLFPPGSAPSRFRSCSRDGSIITMAATNQKGSMILTIMKVLAPMA